MIATRTNVDGFGGNGQVYFSDVTPKIVKFLSRKKCGIGHLQYQCMNVTHAIQNLLVCSFSG